MNVRMLSFIVLAAAASPIAAQDAKPETKPGAQQAAPAEREIKVKDLIEQLGADDYRERRSAEQDLLTLGDKALAELEQAAKDHDDPEVRWRARRVARKIESGEPDKLTPQGDEPQTGPLDPMDGDRLESLMDRMERLLDRDFPYVYGRPFGDIQREMAEMQRHMDRLRGQFGAMPQLQPGQSGVESSENMSMRIGPDGVRLEVGEKTPDGKTETKVYEAPDMATFREKYPDVADRYFSGANGVFRFQSGPTWDLPGLDRLRAPGLRVQPRAAQPPALQPPAVAPPVPPEGRRLGVYMRDLAPQVREFLRLDEGQGFVVDSVEKDSLAQALGIESGDVVVEVAGKKIHSAADVADALGAIDAGGSVEVQINRRGRDLTLKAEKKVSAASGKLQEKGRIR